MTQENMAPARPSAEETSFKPTESMLLSLRQTKPWARLMSILGFISIGFMAIAGIINMVAFPQEGGGETIFLGTFSAIMNVLVGLLYFFPSLYLFTFSSSIGRLLDGGGVKEMEATLVNQKSFWKFIGILTLVMICIAIVGIVAAIAIPMLVSNS